MKFIFPNFRIIFAEAMLTLLQVINYYALAHEGSTEDIAAAVIFGILIAALMIMAVVFLPHFFVFDRDGVRIYYVLFMKKEAKWSDVISIDKVDSGSNTKPPNLYSYDITPMDGRDLFFMDDKVNKTWYIRLIIEHYWDGTIDDDGLFARIRRSRSEPKNTFRAEAEERKIKSAVHEVLKPYRDRFKAAGINISISFNYEGEEKRPLNDNYHYNALFKLKRMDDGTEDEIEFSLLRVVRGKKEYRPIPIKNALREIEEILSEELSEISEENRIAFSHSDIE